MREIQSASTSPRQLVHHSLLAPALRTGGSRGGYQSPRLPARSGRRRPGSRARRVGRRRTSRAGAARGRPLRSAAAGRAPASPGPARTAGQVAHAYTHRHTKRTETHTDTQSAQTVDSPAGQAAPLDARRDRVGRRTHFRWGVSPGITHNSSRPCGVFLNGYGAPGPLLSWRQKITL